jgi:AcrR family transcriptional regulator
MRVFAARGLVGTPTSDVAKAAGISHAYLFRLFPTKSDLAVAVVRRTHERVYDAFAAAAAQAKKKGEHPMYAMGEAYGRLLENRELLLLQLHAHAASPEDPAIRDAARDGFERLVQLVERETGAPAATVGGFFATGMLMNVMAALDAGATGSHWADVLAEYCLDDLSG